MNRDNARPGIAREQKTVAAMIRLYCRAWHGKKNELCTECLELEEYACARLDRCTYGENKPACVHCSIHCYKPVLRERIKSIMRFAGPRLIWRHPLLTFSHILLMLKKRR